MQHILKDLDKVTRELELQKQEESKLKGGIESINEQLKELGLNSDVEAEARLKELSAKSDALYEELEGKLDRAKSLLKMS